MNVAEAFGDTNILIYAYNQALFALYRIQGIGQTTIEKALHLAQTYQYSYWDSLIIAAALEANCAILYSEDMQHGQIFNNQLTIVNPFRSMRSA
jgi:predicted nucleic acid-binding protein